MAVIRWAGMSGENRLQDPKLIPDSACVLSRNHKPTRGDLRPWREPKLVATVPAGTKTIHRMGKDVVSDSDYWLSWSSVVHAVRGITAGDTTERTYYTGDGAPKVTDNIIGLASAPYPTTSRPLGVPAPETPLLVQTDAGDWEGELNGYTYVYTFVTDWGWESAPSPASQINTRQTDATATLSGFSSAPAGNHGINRIRIYRTQTGSSSGTDLFFLREIAYGVTTTKDDNRALGGVIPTYDVSIPGSAWLHAPDDLSHLIPLWNGMMAGISNGAVRICQAYHPFAWPLAYEIVATGARAVALGKAGQNLLVLTDGRPLVVSGTGPDSMDQAPLEFQQACVAPRSVVSMGSGVAWASMDGLCWWGPGAAPRILTSGFMSREDWQAIKPETVIGQMYEGLYFGSYDDGSGRKGFVIDPANPAGFFPLEVGYEAMHFDDSQDQLYVVSGTSVLRWDAGATFMTARAKSKEYRLPLPTSFGYIEAIASQYPVQIKLEYPNMHPDDVAFIKTLMPFMDSRDASTLRYVATIRGPGPEALPGGWMSDAIQMEIETKVGVQGVAIATTVEEIAQT